MSGEYGECGKTSHLNVSKYFVTTTLATWVRALLWRKITLSCLCSYSSHFSMHNSNKSIVADTDRRNGIIRFQQLIVNKTFLIPDTEHDLRSMNVRLWCWCWNRLTGLSIVFFLLGIVVEYPLLISSHNPMQKTFSVVFKSAVRKWKIAFQCLSVSVHKAPNFLVFESFPWLSIIQKRLVELLPMILQAPLAFDSDLRVMSLILCLRIFWLSRARLVFNAEISILETSKPFPMIYQLEQCHHKLRQAFDGFQPHLSSN